MNASYYILFIVMRQKEKKGDDHELKPVIQFKSLFNSCNQMFSQ